MSPTRRAHDAFTCFLVFVVAWWKLLSSRSEQHLTARRISRLCRWKSCVISLVEKAETSFRGKRMNQASKRFRLPFDSAKQLLLITLLYERNFHSKFQQINTNSIAHMRNACSFPYNSIYVFEVDCFRASNKKCFVKSC